MYTQAQINKLISRVTKSTVDTFQADTEYVMKIVDQQKTKMKKAVIKDMLKLVKAKAMTAFTKSGKRRAKGLSREGKKAKMKKAVIKDMLKLVKAKAMTAFTKS